jgi:DNA processing protein
MKMNLSPSSVSIGSPEYPPRLRILPDAPEELHYLGTLPEDCPTVAIVGARMCSSYGHSQAYAFGRELAAKGVQIVSGMAMGIDGYALEGALDAGGRAFAVLGSGADVCYPRSNRSIYQRLREHGGILSELPDGDGPLPWHFPMRNRIISALADIVLVVEAKEKSGSLITVDFALEQGKTVFAVPGRIGDLLSDGCNRLIAQGAGIACSPESLLAELPSFSAQKSPEEAEHSASPGISPEASSVLSCFETEQQLGYDDLISASSLAPPQLSLALMELILGGRIRESSGGTYVRTDRRI